MSFGKVTAYPELHVLDSTDPAQIRAIEKQIDLANTIFIVSSKSGSTLEPNIYKQYFFERAKQVVGEKEAGKRFLAITDPGSKMQMVAVAFFCFALSEVEGRVAEGSQYFILCSYMRINENKPPTTKIVFLL